MSALKAGLTQKEDPDDVCGPYKRGEHCGPGNDRHTSGGGEKVSHKGWPKVSGIFWVVNDSPNHNRIGGPDNDELLGHHGSDHIEGKGGPRHPLGRLGPQEQQRAPARRPCWAAPATTGSTRATAPTVVRGGPGNDHVWAYYGKGRYRLRARSKDSARVHLNGPFRVHNCETIGHFCGFGSDGHGGCLKPGEKRSRRKSSTD